MKILILTALLSSFLFIVECDYKVWKYHLDHHGHEIENVHEIINKPHSHYAKKKYEIFCDNFARIVKHNDAYHRGECTFKKAVNRFTHYTYDEFKKNYLMNIDLKIEKIKKSRKPRKRTFYRNNYKTLSLALNKTTSVSMLSSDDKVYLDWSSLGCVDEVADQGECGSCYSFVSISALESHICIERTRKIVPLSKQQILDCSYKGVKDSTGKSYRNQGCTGGNLKYAYDYMSINGNMEEEAYPYAKYNPALSRKTGYSGECDFEKRKATRYVKNDVKISGFREMIKAIRKGPIGCYIYASESAYSYHSGMLTTDEECNGIGNSVNHAVLIVGFGREKGKFYWKAKNTWGKDWGENGYFKIAIGRNLCNIEMQCRFPVLI